MICALFNIFSIYGRSNHQGDGDCACVVVICGCPHGMYLVSKAAHDPLVGASPLLGRTSAYIHVLRVSSIQCMTY